VEQLGAALSDKGQEVRMAAVRALGEIGNAEAATALITSIPDTNPSVHQAAILAVKGIGAPAAEALTAALSHDSEERRVIAHELLVNIGAPAARPLSAALADERRAVREAAATVLKQLYKARKLGRTELGEITGALLHCGLAGEERSRIAVLAGFHRDVHGDHTMPSDCCGHVDSHEDEALI
jgi:HEAT repeat protein